MIVYIQASAKKINQNDIHKKYKKTLFKNFAQNWRTWRANGCKSGKIHGCGGSAQECGFTNERIAFCQC
ncbi:MAG: hypothetical protein K2O60_09445 [Ruminococcus sp.]|nr:hypothetical protein [Ruminococcus sp.]